MTEADLVPTADTAWPPAGYLEDDPRPLRAEAFEGLAYEEIVGRFGGPLPNAPHGYCLARPKEGSSRKHPCTQPALENGRCYWHGGASLKGIAHPNFKHGGNSKYMPARLLERYQRSLDDPNLIELRDQMALLDARLSDLLTRVDHGEAATHWAEMRKAWKAYRRALAGGKDEKIAEAFRALEDAIEEGYLDSAAWTEVREILEQRRKLADTERRRIVDLKLMVPVEEATAAIAAMTRAFREEVKDPDVLARISTRATAILNGRDRGRS